MKSKIIILTTLVILFVYGCLEIKSSPQLLLKIIFKKNSYGVKDVVELKVNNNTKKKVVYGIGLDLKYENKWIEYLYNSETPMLGPYVYFELEPNEQRIHYWPNAKTDAMRKPYDKNLKLRFRVSCGLNKNNSTNEIHAAPIVHSEEFEFRVR